MINMTEKELIRRCRKKNAKAQKLLYKTYHGSLLGVCLRYGKSKAEAEDILQMGMMKIYKSIGSYSGKGSFEGWMKRIIVNTAVDNFRKNHKHYYHENLDDVYGDTKLAGNIPDNLEVKDILNTIQRLSPGYRMVFNLYAIEGYNHKEIANKLGISESTSKTQLMKARLKLQKMLLSIERMPEYTSDEKTPPVYQKILKKDALVTVDLVTQE